MGILTERYVRAMQVSYPDQDDELIIQFDRLSDIVEIPLGFQPLGITNQPIGLGSPDKVIIADYFMPAFMLAEVWRNEHSLHFKTRRVNSVEVLPGITARLFLGAPEFSDKDRGQTAIWASDDRLWVSRNGDRSFFVFTPAVEKDGNWKLISKFTLPGHPHKDGLMIDSAAILKAENKFYLHVVESEDAHGYWYNSCYESRDGKSWKWQNSRKSVPWLYGIGISKPDNGVSCNQWFVTDFRCKAQSPGIYCETTLVVPGVNGNGICFLSDGSALVTRYGHGRGPFGVPGALIYIPANRLHS